jgi:hypothetical protein
MIYFERVTGSGQAAAHIQTPCDPLYAATEYSWDHPGFRGLLQVSVQAVVHGRPQLLPYLVWVGGPGLCRMATDGAATQEPEADWSVVG